MAVTPLSDKPESTPMSLPPVIVRALERLAELDGHRNRSAVVRKLVAKEMQEVVGPNWRDILVVAGREQVPA